MYHPTAGRFLSRDPIGFRGGDPNLYCYVQNRPTSNTDPSGLDVYLYEPTGAVSSGKKHFVLLWVDPKTSQSVTYEGGGHISHETSGGVAGLGAFAYPDIGFPAPRRAPPDVPHQKGGPPIILGVEKYNTFKDFFAVHSSRLTPVQTGAKDSATEYAALEKAFAATDQVRYYHPIGPNSNTYLHQLIVNAGFTPPAKPAGATGYDYEGPWGYGKEYFTAFGKPTPAYVNRLTSKVNLMSSPSAPVAAYGFLKLAVESLFDWDW